jgi:DNA-binding NarL/FixJ family response regulator
MLNCLWGVDSRKQGTSCRSRHADVKRTFIRRQLRWCHISPLFNAANHKTERLPFVFLTKLDHTNLAAPALELGSVAFVLKCSGGWELIQAIDRIVQGRCFLILNLITEDWVAAKDRARQLSQGLTARQNDTVRLFAEKRTLKEIATALGLGDKTVELHKYKTMAVFNLKNNANLVLFAVKRGLVSVHPDFYLRP